MSFATKIGMVGLLAVAGIVAAPAASALERGEFQDGLYTDPFLGPQKSSGEKYITLGGGLRLFVCDRIDIGFGASFAVSDDHHGEGIATLLLEQLARVALDWRIRRFVAQTLHGNHAMQLVFRTVGCPVTIRRDDDVTEVAIELDAVALEEAAARRATIAEGAARLTAPGPTVR